MGRLDKPKVEYIKGLSPAIAVEQRVNSSNPRSTVGTKTEIYDYLKLLFARIGKTYSPISGNLVKRDEVSDVISQIKKIKSGTKVLILASIEPDSKRSINDRLKIFTNKVLLVCFMMEKLSK